jgi:two-component system sensor kinase FixL
LVVITERNALGGLTGLLDVLGHVGIVERPIHPAVLRKAVQAALRSRARQREAEAHLLQRETAEEHLRHLTDTLETRVRERMSELRTANEQLLLEVKERRDAEERLRDSEELYRHTIELGQQIVWTAEADGTFQSISPRFHTITGLPRDALPQQAVHPEDRHKLLTEWEGAVRDARPHQIEHRLRMRDGSYRHFRTRAAPLRSQQGDVVRWYGTMEDVHEQKQAEAALLAAEERYRLAARATNDAIWDLNLLTDEIRWNDSARPVFGYALFDKPTRLAWWEFHLHPDDREGVVAGFHAALAGTGSRWAAGYRFLTAAGSYADIFDRGFIIRDEKGRAVRAVGAMTDVTDRRRAEGELRKLQSELIHVSRLSAMGTMASTLAHELNQPLIAVSSYVRGSRRLLQKVDAPLMPQVLEALDAAEAGALRAGQILRRLRELVSGGGVSVRSEDLGKLIQEASLIGFVDEHLLAVTHRIELDPAAAWVAVDRIQIQQVLINLIRNAVQAMQDLPRREVLIKTRAVEDGMAEVSVADTGGGIPPKVREALFSPFQTTKAEGMGIGLSISRTIVEAHGGKIWAEEWEGGGTVFRFTLPRANEPPKNDGAAPLA